MRTIRMSCMWLRNYGKNVWEQKYCWTKKYEYVGTKKQKNKQNKTKTNKNKNKKQNKANKQKNWLEFGEFPFPCLLYTLAT